jgi:flagellin-like protein
MSRPRARKGITPVLATVILIAMTLISAISLGGFVFGLFGSFTSNAVVSAQFYSCTSTGTTCTLTLYNSGSADTTISTGPACVVLVYGGQTVDATSCTATSSTVVAGSSLAITANFATSFGAISGQVLTGHMLLGDNSIVQFSGTFS